MMAAQKIMLCSHHCISMVSARYMSMLWPPQLQGFLDETDHLDPLQSCFRPGFEMENVLVTLLGDLGRDLDRGNASLLILLCILMAFNSICCDILPECLAGLGLDRPLLYWFYSFLSNRSQKMLLGDYCFSLLHMGLLRGQFCLTST